MSKHDNHSFHTPGDRDPAEPLIFGGLLFFFHVIGIVISIGGLTTGGFRFGSSVFSLGSVILLWAFIPRIYYLRKGDSFSDRATKGFYYMFNALISYILLLLLISGTLYILGTLVDITGISMSWLGNRRIGRFLSLLILCHNIFLVAVAAIGLQHHLAGKPYRYPFSKQFLRVSSENV